MHLGWGLHLGRYVGRRRPQNIGRCSDCCYQGNRREFGPELNSLHLTYRLLHRIKELARFCWSPPCYGGGCCFGLVVPGLSATEINPGNRGPSTIESFRLIRRADRSCLGGCFPCHRIVGTGGRSPHRPLGTAACQLRFCRRCVFANSAGSGAGERDGAAAAVLD